MPPVQFTVHELGFDDNIPVDSGMSNDQGEFEFKCKNTEEGLYRVTFGQDKYLLLALNKGDHPTINGEWNALENYTVSGSRSSTVLKSFLVNLRENINDIKTLAVIKDSVEAREQNDSLKLSVEKDLQEVNARFMQYIKGFADTTQSVASALFAVNLIKPQFEGPFLTTFYEGITKRFPSSTSAKQFAQRFLQGNKQDQAEETDQLKINQAAPDFSAETPDGKLLKLSDFKGKYILVDFWASWCAPCRKENPNVVNAWNANKNKNFTIIGISLDSNKENWMKAIEKDGLTWNHISELVGWQSVIARNYGIEEIPSNVLIDPSGNIIAMNLKGDALTTKLAEVLP